MLNSQDFREVEKRKSEFAFDLSQQKKSVDKAALDDIPQNMNQSERVSSFIRLSKVDEAEDEISLGAKIIDIRKYKDERMRVGMSVFNEENEVKEPQFKSKLSQGNDDKFQFMKYDKEDTHRMAIVKEELSGYYKLLKEESEFQSDDEKAKEEAQARFARSKLVALQGIVSTCNKYIANRWPLSRQGRERLNEVKLLRREAIKELGEHAGHPGWRLAGEYLKFGLKAVTAPAWAPALVPYYMLKGVAKGVYYSGKWAGRVTKRIAKKTGRAIARKARHFADGVADSFSSWKAFGATLLAIGAALIYGTAVNVVNTLETAATFVPWLLCSMVTAPRYFYLLSKGKVDLHGVAINGSERNVRCMAWSLPTPHRYSTWFKAFYYNGAYSRYIRPQGAFAKKTALNDADDKKKKPDNGRAQDIHMIYNNRLKGRGGSHDQYDVSWQGPTRDVYYHSTTLKFKKFFELFRYSNKDDFENVHQRSNEDYTNGFDEEDDELYDEQIKK